MKSIFSLAVSVIVGILLGSVGTYFFIESKFDQEVRGQVFDECFQYYANLEKNSGIDISTVQVCRDKANSF